MEEEPVNGQSDQDGPSPEPAQAPPQDPIP